MTFYQQEIERVRKEIFSNQGQINAVVGIKRYIDTHYSSKLDLDVLANERFLSKYHLLRVFKKYYGQTPRQYLIETRIQKSKEYLIQGISVTETCFAVGFESLGSFSTLFKNRTGRSPSKFQKEQLSRKE